MLFLNKWEKAIRFTQYYCFYDSRGIDPGELLPREPPTLNPTENFSSENTPALPQSFVAGFLLLNMFSYWYVDYSSVSSSDFLGVFKNQSIYNGVTPMGRKSLGYISPWDNYLWDNYLKELTGGGSLGSYSPGTILQKAIPVTRVFTKIAWKKYLLITS